MVKAFVKARAERDRFAGLNEQARRLQVRQEMIARWFGMLMTVFQAAGPALILGFGAWLVITGRTTAGTVFVFATVLGGRLTGSLTSLATMHVNVTGSLAVFRRLFEYIDLPPEVADAPGARDLGEVRGAIRFEDVTFTYPGGGRPALDEITVDIAARRLSTILSADVILVLGHGRLAEHGTDAGLLDRGGLYATLYQRQFLAQDREAVPT